MSLEFLSPAAAALARSPMEHEALAAGAELERRDGWNVAVRFDGAEAERMRCRTTVGFADRSQLGKIEVQAAPADLAAIAGEWLDSGGATRADGGGATDAGDRIALGRAARFDDAWWCPYTPERALVLCEPGASAAMLERLARAASRRDGLTSVTDVTAAFGALVIAGPLAREAIARFCALDLRDAVAPVEGFRPGSVARTPGAILRAGEHSFLMLFGAALGRYVWTVVADAAQSLGGGPVGLDALEEASSHA